jgi:hypothetical protein
MEVHHSSVVWGLRDGDALLVPTTATKQKARNLARHPRFSASIFDTQNPYQLGRDPGNCGADRGPGQDLPRELSEKYLGEDPPPEPSELRRLIVRVVAEKINNFSTR